MINIEKLYNSRTAVTYGDSIQKEFNEYSKSCGEYKWIEYTRCHYDKEYFLSSGFYRYLLNKNRTELIDKIL